MAGRQHISHTLDGRTILAPMLMRHGPPPGHQPLNPASTDFLESKVAAQAAELEALAVDNHQLTAALVALKGDLTAVKQDEQRLRAHIKSMQNESDVKIGVMLDKIAAMELDVRAGEKVRRELQEAHTEAQCLVKSRMELGAEIQLASDELQDVLVKIKNLPDLHADLDNLRNEHKRLRALFEHEKATNVEKVEQMHLMEQKLIGMAREIEKLHADVMNAEKRSRDACADSMQSSATISAPMTYGASYASSETSQPPLMHAGSLYGDPYARTAPYHSGIGDPVSETSAASAGAGTQGWGGSYDSMIGRRR